MSISSRLLHRIADPSLPQKERAKLRCQLAKELEDVGNHEAARETMGELWSRVGECPVLDELDEATAAEVLLRVGTLTGWLGSTRQIEVKAVVRYETRIVERALKEARGVVSHSAELLGIKRQRLDAMLKGRGGHTSLAHLRTLLERRPRSLMFRGDEDCPETRAVVVLHVEDDSVIADGVSMTLQGEGWSVETCATGAAALEKLESGERFDVLLFDNNLPDTNGIELIKQTRALAHRQQTPIIMLSGDEVETEALRAGANAFLRKPGDAGSIPETAARLLACKKGGES